MFFESDIDMIQRDELMVLEFDEETRSLPCRKCGHLTCSTEALENHDKTSHGNDKRFSCRNYNKEFRKDRRKLLHEGYCLGQYYSDIVALYLKWVEFNQWCLIA